MKDYRLREFDDRDDGINFFLAVLAAIAFLVIIAGITFLALI